MSDRPAGPPRLVIFDLDGVVYRGHQAIAGAPELIGELHDRGVAVRYATNNSMATRAAYVERLAGLGIRATADELVTSTSATVAHLQAHLPEVRCVLAVGASGMLDELGAAGLDATPAAEAAPDGYDGGPLPRAYDAVIAGLDQQFDYARLATAASAIRAGARFIATNADLRFPTPVGFLPGAGSVVAAIRAAAGDVAPLVIGKPEPAMFRSIVDTAGVPDEAVVVVGDNPDADIVAARRAGLFSVLVLTGIADTGMAATLDGQRRPDAVAADPFELGLLLARWLS
jgi:HAD superfamily hydrolase (TIGR01450 family)